MPGRRRADITFDGTRCHDVASWISRRSASEFRLATEEDRLDGFAELGQSSVGWVSNADGRSSDLPCKPIHIIEVRFHGRNIAFSCFAMPLTRIPAANAPPQIATHVAMTIAKKQQLCPDCAMLLLSTRKSQYLASAWNGGLGPESGARDDCGFPPVRAKGDPRCERVASLRRRS